MLIVFQKAFLCFYYLELDALGDEMFLEDDAAYLDEASMAPSVPGSLPGEAEPTSSRTKVLL